jgi:hypothetical protein
MRALSLAIFLTLISFTPLAPNSYAQMHRSAHGGSPAGAGHSVFPAYPKRTMRPSAPMGHSPTMAGHANPAPQNHYAPSATHEDRLGNRVSDDHLNRVEFAHQRSINVMRTSPGINNHVSFHSAAYSGTLHPIYMHKQTLYTDHFNHYHAYIVDHPGYWRPWHDHYFYGGFYYGFHPVPDMSIYFYNPLVHWFYIGTWDDNYYRTWYGPEYEAYPQLNRPFNYYGVYYPTDNLRQLLFGVSAMPVEKQARFRTGITAFTQEVSQQVANVSHQHVVLNNGDIAVTHYETLGQDDGLDLEGVVTFQSKAYSFKGVINLDPANTVQVFVAGDSDSNPTPAQLKSLDDMNSSINTLRGDATPNEDSGVKAPNLSSDGPEYPNAPAASGQVSADPK